ncbi:gp53-like domain-containing protein, partial [Cronobacter sakazakii]|uniref:gp53-like domain-containing protein n=1 Tax=Cronobacter sakazakii TaxID=28141 RepID=UPI00387B89D5
PGNYANFDARYQAKNTANRASSGWYKDTSTGLIIQWGVAKRSADSTSIANPIAFPNAALCTNLTVIWGGHFTDQNVFCQPVDRTRFNYIAGSGEVSSYFLAIGYSPVTMRILTPVIRRRTPRIAPQAAGIKTPRPG